MIEIQLKSTRLKLSDYLAIICIPMQSLTIIHCNIETQLNPSSSNS